MLASIVDDLPPQEQLHRRLLRFLHSCSLSANPIVLRAHKEVIEGSGSATSDSLSGLCSLFGIDRMDLPGKVRPQRRSNPAGQAVRDFILLKEQTRDSDIDWIILHLATHCLMQHSCAPFYQLLTVSCLFFFLHFDANKCYY